MNEQGAKGGFERGVLDVPFWAVAQEAGLI
jgi:hypothetical protein